MMISLRLTLLGWLVFCPLTLLFSGCESDGRSGPSDHHDHYYAGYGGMWYYDDDYPDYVVLPPGSSGPPDQGTDGRPHPEHPIAKPRPDRPQTLPSQRPNRSSGMSSRSRPSLPSRSGGGGRRR